MNTLDQPDDTFVSDLLRTVAAGAMICLAGLWLLSALFIAWIAYDQCTLPNDNGLACDKSLNYWLTLYQPLLAIPGVLAALLASRRLPRRTGDRRLASRLGFPLAVASLFFMLWIGALVVT